MSGGGRYRYLFSPLRVGPLTLRNRIVFSAHLTNYATGGLPSQQHAAYYAARAAGGAGLIITEEHSTHPTDWPYEKLIHGFHPEVIPGYRRITAAVHAHDVPILAQLNHNGGQGTGMYSRLPVWAPSPVPDPLFREVPKAVETGEIREIVAGYGLVAGHCAEGGFDGVELQCSHSSIVRGFLSPATNLRTDAYGGSLANRARLLLEIIGVVREAIGQDRALGVRICGDELIEDGITITEAVAVAQMAEATGKVDYINTSIGVATATLYMIEASMRIPPGYAMFIPASIRRAVSLPVVGVGRFKDPLQADRALADGQCDLVGVVRGQIADPDFAAKARAGHAAQIRTCLSCNQECVGRMGLNRWLGCIENPRTGREAVPLPPPRRPGRRVIVVGGGNTAIDCVRVALREGAEDSILVYRRTRKEMPAEYYEVDDAEEEGVQFEFLRNPTRLIAENGKVVGVEVVVVELGEPDESGRRRPAPKPGSEYVIPCDMVIPAIGQDPDLDYLTEEDFGIQQTRWKSILTHGGTMMTDCEGVFAGGDCEYGAMTVVVAVGHGRRAPRGMHRWLSEGKACLNDEEGMGDIVKQIGVFQKNENVGILGGLHREHQPKVKGSERAKNYEEIELAMPESQAVREAERCLRCYRVAMVALS